MAQGEINPVLMIIVMVITGLAFFLTTWVALLGGSPLMPFVMGFAFVATIIAFRRQRAAA